MMKFEESFRRYQDGSATPEERAYVTEELEKARLIEEFLASELPGLPEPAAPDASREFRQVRRRLNRRTRRLLLAVFAGVAALVLILQLVIFPAVNATVYRSCDDGSVSDFDAFMSVATQLHIPGATYTGSWAENTGFGTQTISLQFWGEEAAALSLSIRLTCGQLGPLSGDVPQLQQAGYHHTGDFINESGLPAAELSARQERLAAWWAELPEYVAVSAAVTFAQPLTLAEYADFLNTAQDGTLSCGAALVKTDSNMNPLYLQLGSAGLSLQELNDAYPALFLTSPATTASTMQQHLESQLQYMVDHPKLSRWFFAYSDSSGMGYQAILTDVQTNGAQIQGVYVTGTPSAMRALQSDGRVASISPRSNTIAPIL